LALSLHNSSTVRTRLLPSEYCSVDRLEHDVLQIKKLASAFDMEAFGTEGEGVAKLEEWLESRVFTQAAFIESSADLKDEREDAQDEERMREDEALRGLSSADVEKDVKPLEVKESVAVKKVI
jgi:hypothetical protein